MAELHPGIEPLSPYLNAWGMSHQEEVLKASGYYRVKELEGEVETLRYEVMEAAERGMND